MTAHPTRLDGARLPAVVTLPHVGPDDDDDDPPGLTDEEAMARVEAGRANTVQGGVSRTVPQILRANVLTRFNAILGGLLVVVVLVGPPQDGLFGVVLVVNAFIGIGQELRAKRTLDRLAVLTAPTAHVRRSGRTVELAVDRVVADDVLVLRPGDQVVVDAVVLAADGLEVDESLLTGEAEPVVAGPGSEVRSGSFVVAGTGAIRATRVGADAYAQRLQSDARRFAVVRSELAQGTNHILRVVTWVMVPATALLVTSQLLRSGQSLADALRSSVAGVSAMVPEGLVLLTTIAFALGALRLAKRRVLVQELAAIEGLARVDVVCIDKTGTLTEPGMVVHGVEPLGDTADGLLRDVLGALAGADPARNATLGAVAAAFPSPPWRPVGRIPFSSARKWSAAQFEGHGTWVIGAPDVLRNHLQAHTFPDGAVQRHSDAGRRVLLVAGTTGDAATSGAVKGAGAPARRTDELPQGLEPAGIVVLEEQIRADAASTIRYLLDQGVTPKVLSGDDPRTVAAIAARVGIPQADAPVDARLLPDDVASITAALESASVFGRVQPHQKRAMVEALQGAGHVVAMTGDGVNDVPALKQADIGIAMGTGSQASRSVGRIILLDSSFAAFPHVVAEGRRVIFNIERVANLFVTKTVYAAALAVVVGVLGVPFPFYPRHLTAVSTLTIGVPGFFLALAAGAPRARPGYVRRVAWFTVPAGAVVATSTFAAYALARADSGTSAAQARTAATIVLFALGLWVLGALSRPLRPARVGLLVAMAGAGALAMVVPLSSRVFALHVPSATILVVVLAIAAGGAAGISVLLRAVRSRAR